MLSGIAPFPQAFPCPEQADGDLRRLPAEMRQALARSEFAVHYQPRLALPSGAVRGCEALLRWPGRKRGAVPPALFIPAAERSGLIDAIGGWVLDEACREARQWGGHRVSVNVSGRQLRSGVIAAQVAGALARSGLAAESLDIEVTEAVLIAGGDEALLALSAVRDLGVGVALDDFGTGWASLAMLKRLPLTAMKLDRALGRELPGDREDAAMVRAMIGAGHALGLTVVAEGIETEAQRACLARLGCDEGQGYLFSHPLPAALIRPFAAPHDVACPGGLGGPASADDRYRHAA